MRRFSHHRWIRFVRFQREARDKLARVTWPTRRQLIASTIVVVATVIALTAMVFGLDLLFSRLVVRWFGT